MYTITFLRYLLVTTVTYISTVIYWAMFFVHTCILLVSIITQGGGSLAHIYGFLKLLCPSMHA